MIENKVKRALLSGGTCVGTMITDARTPAIAQVLANAGFDYFILDTEHGAFSMETVADLMLMSRLVGIAPFVRVPANTPDYVSRVLDGGALGVIAPHIRSADEAKAVVSAAKFPPLGERSNAGGLPHLHFRSFPAAEACAALNDATMVVVQFESAAALDRAEEIVAVDGVDMVLLGLNDLLADWGIPGEYDHPRVREAYAKTIAACRKRGKHCGVGGLATRPDLAAEFVKMGARYVSTGTDLAFLLSACAARAQQVKEIKL